MSFILFSVLSKICILIFWPIFFSRSSYIFPLPNLFSYFPFLVNVFLNLFKALCSRKPTPALTNYSFLSALFPSLNIKAAFDNSVQSAIYQNTMHRMILLTKLHNTCYVSQGTFKSQSHSLTTLCLHQWCTHKSLTTGSFECEES